jgi:hypothetical protein
MARYVFAFIILFLYLVPEGAFMGVVRWDGAVVAGHGSELLPGAFSALRSPHFLPGGGDSAVPPVLGKRERNDGAHAKESGPAERWLFFPLPSESD